jgi:uncharacterized protein
LKPLNQSQAGRLLHFLAEAVFHHPRSFCYIQLLFVLVCLAYTVTTLRFSTSKQDLISPHESYWRQFLEFKKAFNIHENLFVLVESESQEKNREFVERLAARLRADDEFSAVYYRAGLELMGPKALLFLPEETLAGLQQNLRTNQPLFQTYSRVGNLEALFALVNRQFRLADAPGSEGPKPGSLSRSLPALQWVVDSAANCIESGASPLTPNIAALLGNSQGENSPNAVAPGTPQPGKNPSPPLKGKIHGEPRQELYLTFDRGRIYVLVAQAKDPDQEDSAIRHLRKWIGQTRSEVPGVNAELTGEPVLTHDEMQQARQDTEVAALVALALTGLIFIVSCRSVLRPLIATLCLLIGICYTLGFATLMVGRLNILSITLVPILIGLAIDYGVHLIFRYEEELRQGQSRRFAIGKALGFTGIGVITNALTIAGAFYFIVLTDFKGMREMGLIAGTGVIVCLVPMLTLLPLFLVRGQPDPPAPRDAGGQPHRPDPLRISLQSSAHPRSVARAKNSRLAWIEQLCLRRPWWVLACGAVFTLFTLVGACKVQFDYNLLDLQSRGLPAVRMQRELIRVGSHSLLYCAVIADSLPQAVAWEQRINQLPSVARVISLVKYLTEDQERKLALIHDVKQDLEAIPLPELDTRPVNLPDLNQTLFSLQGYLGPAINTLRSEGTNQAREAQLESLRNSVIRLRRLLARNLPSSAERLTAFQQLFFGSLHETVSLVKQQDDRQRLQPEDVPAFLREFFISHSGKFLLQVYPKEDVWQRDKQEKFIAELRTVDPNVTGSPVQFYEYTSRLKRDVEKAAACAASIIAVLVFLHFHRVGSVLLALLPVALGLCWMLGLMGWLGLPFNPVNIISLVLVIGIGVTNGVHILNRFAEEAQPNILARSTGRDVLVSALNTMAGFGSLLIAKHQGIASLGGVMAIGTATCVVASLALLPAVLTLLCRVGWCPTDLPPQAPAQPSVAAEPPASP